MIANTYAGKHKKVVVAPPKTPKVPKAVSQQRIEMQIELGERWEESGVGILCGVSLFLLTIILFLLLIG